MCNNIKKGIINKLQETSSNYSDIYIKEEHQDAAKETLNKLRSDFTILHDENKMKNIWDNAFNFIYAKQIAEYYNNDICINATHLFILQKNGSSYSKTAIGYYFDEIVQRIFNCWDYIFQSLNMYWDLGFLSSTKEREILSEIYTKKWDFIETDDGFQLICSEYSEDKLRIINQTLKKDLKVLHSDTIKKQIKKDGCFSIIPEFDSLMSLFNDPNCVKLKKEYRNPITHSNSSTFKMRIDSNDALFPGKGLSFSNATIVTDETIILVKNSLEKLKSGIQILLHIIWNSIVPNSKHNENISYYGVYLKCEACKFEDSMTQETYEAFQRNSFNFQCPICAKPLTISDNLNLNERDYNQLLLDTQKVENQIQYYSQSNASK